MRKTNKPVGKEMKGLLLGLAILLVSTLVFQGLTQVVTAAEYNKTSIVPTNYAAVRDESNSIDRKIVAEGYKKANYTVKDNGLENNRNQTPSSKDMTKEEAAEAGVQALWDIYGISLEGQVVEMGYQRANEDYPRSSWYGDVYIDGKLLYGFDVDSVTGELFNVYYNRTLGKKVSVGFDLDLQNDNGGEYQTLVKETAEKLNIVHGSVASVKYNCQGTQNDDPDITFDIKGENGEVAQLTFSRYDKALLNITFNGRQQYVLKYVEKMDREMNESSSETRVIDGNENENPRLEIIPEY